MRPNLQREHAISWGILALAVVVAVAVGWWLRERAAAASRAFESAREAYARRIGSHDLAGLVAKVEDAILDMEGQIGELKRLTGFRRLPPFLVPGDSDLRGSYFSFVFNTVFDELQFLADAKQVAIDGSRIGFADFSGQAVDEGSLQRWLTMLQLVTKGAWLALSTPDESLESVEVLPLSIGNIVETGPAGRPPLVREYPFSMKVRGSLRAIKWLLWQFSLDERTEGSFDAKLNEWLAQRSRELRKEVEVDVPLNDGSVSVGPLILRRITLSSGNTSPRDSVNQLDVTFHLAGMEYVSDADRNERPFERSTPSQRQARATARAL